VRMMLKGRAVTAIALVALALGIGANTAIFSVVNAVLLRPLPYADPDRLVMLWATNPSLRLGIDNLPASAANYVEWRDQNHVFETVSALDAVNLDLTSEGEPEQIACARVSSSFFQLMNVSPEMGRVFSPEEDRPGHNNVVVMSDSLWRGRFGADPDIIGKPLTLGGKSYAVIGVLPAGFQFPGAADLPAYMNLPARTDLWSPIAFTAEQEARRGDHNLAVMARLKPGVPLRAAQAEMSDLARRVEEQEPQAKGYGVNVVSLGEQSVRGVRPALLVMLIAVSFVLLVACANVANLLLARAASRRKEIAIRMALGASRGRIIRQMLAESMALSFAGGVAGTLLSLGGINLLQALSPANIPRLGGVNVDAYVLAFTLLVSLLTGVLFGLAPALQASRFNLNDSLKEGGHGSAGGPRRDRMRALLIVSEVELSLMLLLGAGLMVRSFTGLLRVDPGFDPENVLTIRLALPASRYPESGQQAAFFQQALSRLESLPGVQYAGAVSALPLSGAEEASGFMVEGGPAVDSSEMPMSDRRRASANYFRAMGIRLINGRYFTEADNQSAPPVAIINESFARQFFPDQDPVGKRIKNGGPTSTRPWLTVVGVVQDVKHLALEADARPQVYLSYLQNTSRSMAVVMRSSSGPAGLAAAARNAVWELDKQQTVTDVKTMRQYFWASIAQRRFNMVLLGVFAAVALILAAVGIYGVMSYSVTQREREIGIRMALGAKQTDVLKLVVRQGMIPAFVGVVAGAGGGLALTRLMSSLLFGVSATDAATFASVSLALTAVALAACYVPARRATKVDPMIALGRE
ncbi:MAG: ABC transporter permease, partial [Blastocatellia bacterium]